MYVEWLVTEWKLININIDAIHDSRWHQHGSRSHPRDFWNDVRSFHFSPGIVWPLTRLFAFLHVRAFSYKPYKPPEHPSLPPPTRTLRLRSLGHAFDFRETFREIKSGLIYITDRIRGVEPRPDMGARRVAVMENAFGRSRLSEREKNGATKGVEVVEEVDVDIGGERQWLGVGDDYAYGLAYANRKERSDGLEEAIEKELVKRGVDIRKSGLGECSWWWWDFESWNRTPTRWSR